jgi:hypothetical protein
MRVCALERLALGANCHDWSDAGSDAGGVGGSHDDERTCGTGRGGAQGCVCEQPKVVGDQQPVAHAAADYTRHSIVAVMEEPVTAMIVASPDPDPQRDLLASLQLPLLI